MSAAVLSGVVAALFAASFASAETTADLVARVRDGLAAHRPDAEMAAAVRAAKLDEALGDAAVEALESDGAGPLTLVELDRLRYATESLPHSNWTLTDVPPLPSADEQKRFIERSREMALKYTASLPNFLCTATVRRYSGAKEKLDDTLVLDVSFNGQRDRYRLLTVNGKETIKVLETVGGFHSRGDFGTAQRMIFDPDSQAEFHWERWTRIRGRLAQVYGYHVDATHSHFALDFQAFQKGARMIAAMRGSIFIDAETHNVLRIRLEAEGIPRGFPVTRTVTVVDYGTAEIGGQPYLLPRSSDVRLETKKGPRHNIMEFGNFRRFAGEATISFK